MRRESVLPPCGAGPVCPAGTNAVFCGGTHGSRPTDRCGKPSVGDGVLDVPSARQRRAVFGRTEPSVSTHLVIASQSADWRGNPFPHKGKDGFPRQCEHWLGMTALQGPLDKPGGMGIIINRRGRCDKRSAPELVNDFNGLYSPQKPSPARVAVFAFQSLDSYRDRMTQNMNRKHEKHVCHPLSGL